MTVCYMNADGFMAVSDSESADFKLHLKGEFAIHVAGESAVFKFYLKVN